jgi:ATP-binding cassette subfamily C protein
VIVILERCLALIPPRLRWRWAALVPLLLLTSVLEMLGAAAVYGLIRVLVDPGQARALPVAGALLRMLPTLDERTTVVVFAVLVGLFYLVKNALAVVSTWARVRCAEESTAATSAALLAGYLGAPWTFHLRRASADLIHDTHQAVERVYTFVMASALSALAEGFVALGIVIVLLVAAPAATLVTVTALLVLSLAFLRVTRGITLRLGRQLDVLTRAALRHLQHALGAVKELKVLGREGRFLDAYAADEQARARVRWRYATIVALPRIVVETLFVCGALLVMVLLTDGRSGTGALPILALYAYAGFRIIPSVNRILWLMGDIRFGSAAVERVHADLVALRTSGADASDAAGFRDQLAFERVTYAHEGTDRPALTDVDLVVRRGESVGIVGPTGAGKSTLVDMVVGLLDPTSGRISIDGVDLRTARAGWQRGLGYVPQAIFLVNDTVRRNVALGLLDGEIDDARVGEALRRAQLDGFVSSLPEGLDTVVGERGIRLSGGERQRLGVARALYHRPAVLVLDEATSALDGPTEAALMDALRGAGSETTMLIVAHRVASVRHCDRLVVLRDGRVSDVGGFDELMGRSGEFRALAATAAT